MKRKNGILLMIVLVMVCAFAAADVAINEKNFPDEIFRVYVKYHDSNHDGYLNNSEIKTVREMHFYDPNRDPIDTLQGIEYFTSLEYLTVDEELTTLDVSKNTALTILYCRGNNLTSLDVSKNTALTILNCEGNNLTSLDVSKNTALKILNCSRNQLASLDVSKNTMLTELNCESNQLKRLDVSKNTALKELSCNRNQLIKLDLGKNTALTVLSCNYNHLTSLNLSKSTALTELFCYSNKLTGLDVSKNTALIKIVCEENQLANLDVSKNTKLVHLECQENLLANLNVKGAASLEWLECYSNRLTSLDVSNNTKLQRLECQENLLTSLNVRGAKSLKLLQCYSNQLKNLDVGENATLNQIDCYDNPLTSLNVGKATALSHLDCHSARLTSLDVSGNPSLWVLDCHSNSLTSLDASNKKKLEYLHCQDNSLTSLNVNGSTKLSSLECNNNQLTSLDVSQNTSLRGLTCNNNQLTSLDLSKNKSLQGLDCHTNQLTSLDVSQNAGLDFLACYNNQLTNLDLNKNTSLQHLDCHSNQIKSLDVGKIKTLRHIYCYDNPLTNLIIGKQPELYYLDCHSALLTKLDVSGNTHLERLDCYANQLTSLNVKGTTAMYHMNCSSNCLKSLNVSKSIRLSDFNCSDNQLTRLDVSNNIDLSKLDCHSNQLESLDVSNNTSLSELDCHSNQLTNLSLGKTDFDLSTLDCSDNQLKTVDVSHAPVLCACVASGERISVKSTSSDKKVDELSQNFRIDLTVTVIAGDYISEGRKSPVLNKVRFEKTIIPLNKLTAITAVTTTDANEICMYVGSKLVETWAKDYVSYTDKDSERTWKIHYSFVGTGEKNLTFKAKNDVGISSGKKAKVTVVKEPTLKSVKLSTSSVGVGKKVTITVVTSASAENLCMYDGDSGTNLLKTWRSGYTDNGKTRTWKVKYAFDEACQNKRIFFRAENVAGNSDRKFIYISIVEVPTLFSVQFDDSAAAIKSDTNITAVTSDYADKLCMYADGKLVKTWTTDDSGWEGTRTWHVKYAFAGAGDRTVTFKAGNAAGLSEEKAAKITVYKIPSLKSVKLNTSEIEWGKSVTVTAETSTDTMQLIMYINGKDECWTEGYTDNGTIRTWKIPFYLDEYTDDEGEQTLTFKAGNEAGESAGKTATITVYSKPEIYSAKFDAPKEGYFPKAGVKKDASITAETSISTTKLCMYSEGKLIKTWTEGYTDDGATRIWKVTYAFSGAGERTMGFKAKNAVGLSGEKTAKVTVVKVPTLSSVEFDESSAVIKKDTNITAKTSKDADQLCMYADGKLVKTWTTADDGVYTSYNGEGTRTWHVKYAFSGAGKRTMTFKAGNAAGMSAEKTAVITVVSKAPTVKSVKLNTAVAEWGKNITATVETSTDAMDLEMKTKGRDEYWSDGYTDNGTTRIWKIMFLIDDYADDDGEHTLTFIAWNEAGESTGKTAKITIYLKPEIDRVKFNLSTTVVKEDATITAETSLSTTKLCMYSDGKLVKTWTSGYTDSDSGRIWEVTYAFSGTGERTMRFKACNPIGMSEEKTAVITVTK